jgi:predicted naringenin-chalcone synthase
MVLHSFAILPPENLASQDEGLRWLGWLHAQADHSRPAETFTKLFFRFGCDAKKIQTRGYEHPLYCQRSDDVAARFLNFPIGERMRFFEQVADRRMEQFYQARTGAPSLLVHVSCTGYVSPSAAQKIAIKKGWHESVSISHAYHMGCYAALPAVRQAVDHLAGKQNGKVDIVHNELCTLHLNPHNHAPEQLVVQSLFADGHIGYSVSHETNEAALEVLAVREELIPNSGRAMEWRVSEQGFEMTLAREIPEIIQGAIDGFLLRMCDQAGVKRDELADAIFAIHPGGPRIIDLLEDVLRLSAGQTVYSRQVLLHHGNMSSATLPHIWQKILSDQSVSKGTLVVSFAFGPGLTVFGSILRMVRS